MSYRCGLDAYVADMIGTDAGPPRITCDGCGIRYTLRDDRPPPAWFLDGKAVPGWRMVKQGDLQRLDYCRTCKDKQP